MAVNINGIVKNIGKVSIYTPIIEAIVNSIEAIDQSGRDDGVITIRLIRDSQTYFADDGLSPIRSIEIEDNGVGFTDENLLAFDTLYTEYKIAKGGKGFGRFTYIKFFQNVDCISYFKNGDKVYKREFHFGRKQDIVENEKTQEVGLDTPINTIVKLENLEDKHLQKLEKKVETIARRLVEKLLIFFIDEKFRCPSIVLSDGNEEIVLNDFVKSNDSIEFVGDKNFSIKRGASDISFLTKVFKLYYAGNQSSSVILSAHSREVTTKPLHSYIPEFKDEYFDTIENENGEHINKNYIIRTYVISDYLDEHVSLERSEFDLPKLKGRTLLESVSLEEIEEIAVNVTRDFFSSDVKSRQEKKKARIERFILDEAPWHKPYFEDLDLNAIAFDASNQDIESSLHQAKFLKEQRFKNEVKTILENDNDFTEKFDEIVKGLTDVSKSDLAHYVVLRKSVIDIFKKSLQYQGDGKYDLEKAVHQIIFPLKSNSDNTEYQNHNLWLIDERLSFHEYVSSDEPLEETKDRPDIIIFDKKILVRNDNEISNPIFVFEFKRPQRDDYKEKDDPIKQVNRYVEQIREGNMPAKNGRNILANQNTPAYGFIICDLTPKIRTFCKDAQLTMSPDEQAYFGFHSTYKIYFEVISFDKLVKDSELRNRVFFKKLGIE
jgi:hypothetical protein